MSDNSSDDEFAHLLKRKVDFTNPCNCKARRESGDDGVKSTCPEHGSRLVSLAWQFFTKKDNETAICKICSRWFSYKTSVSNLKKHIIRKHPKMLARWNDSATPSKATKRRQTIEDDSPTKSGAENDSLLKNCDEAGDDTIVDTFKDEGATKDENKTIWDYFENVTLNTAQCRVCDKVIDWLSNTDLKAHLSEEHPEIKVVDENDAKAAKLEPSHEVMFEETYLDEDLLRNEMPARNRRKYLPNRTRNERHDITWEASMDRFGVYVASLMKLLPKRRAANFQIQIINRLVRETMRT